MEPLYADIVLPLSLPPFTFEVGDALRGIIGRGYGVEVPLGEHKVYTGIVWRLHSTKPAYRNIKQAVKIVRPERLVGDSQMALWEWIADYYMCSLGEVMRAALPALLKPSALSGVDFEQKIFSLSTEQRLRLSPAVDSEEALSRALESLLPRKKAQYKALLSFCGGFADTAAIFGGDVARSDVDASAEIIRRLTEAGILESFARERSFDRNTDRTNRLAALSPAQQTALCGIKEAFEKFDTVLLHGITGSGKTELYMHLAAEAMADGRTVLYLLPEIAITKQLVERLQRAFGDSLTVYHSKLTPRARTETYLRLCGSNGGELIVGVRSALFLPLNNLGLIIVDEEHDRSFKQDEPAPRYSARDSAVWMARNLGAKTLLGSATPSLESFHNARNGKYGYVWLGERYGNGRLPRIVVSDTLRSAKRGERRNHFNKELKDAVAECLGEGRQALLFQNRRGFAPYIECPECGWTARCPHCNVTLTYFKGDNLLRCNLCGYNERPTAKCPACHAAAPSPCGFGTEKIEEVASAMFPSARIARLDGDTASSAGRMNRTIEDFEHRRTDILIGTQMITKGFDFEGVSVVGVLNADNMLNQPDFRADERTFQTVTQIAGRAGRSDADGVVVVQTAQPEHPTIVQIAGNDYFAMAESQTADREAFGYPPFTRLILLSLRHRNQPLLEHGAARLAAALKKTIGAQAVTDAHAPAVNKMSDVWVSEILIRAAKGSSLQEVKAAVRKAVTDFSKDKVTRTITVSVNVDPQ